MILKSIAKKYPDVVSSKCCENKCSLVVSKRGDIIILKGECVSKEKPAKRVCDCLIFQNNSVALVELKSGSIDVGKVKEKLESMEEMRGSMKKMLESGEARPIKISEYLA